jgi:hypothetical protein
METFRIGALSGHSQNLCFGVADCGAQFEPRQQSRSRRNRAKAVLNIKELRAASINVT